MPDTIARNSVGSQQRGVSNSHHSRQALFAFAWQFTTVAWWGFAYMLVAIAGPGLDSDHALKAIAVLALVSGFFPLIFTRGRHLSWMVFFVVAALALLSLR